jgi:hydrogenase maturation protease
VALRLRAELPEVDTIDVHELTPDIVEMVSTYECVVFVDASVEDSEVTIREAEEDNVSSPGGSHALSTGKVLALARTLYGRAPLRSLLAAVPGREFDFTEKLSPETARDVETCVALLRTLLAQSST